MRPFSVVALFILLACVPVSAQAQATKISKVMVAYKKPPSRKMPPAFKTYVVQCSSQLPPTYKLYAGPLALTLKLYPLQRVLTADADLHLSVTVGNLDSPGVIDPELVGDGLIITGGIYLPVYYRLTDAKGMIYEDDSSIVSSQLPYTIVLQDVGNMGTNFQELYAQALLDERWELALSQNIDDINGRLNEMFFGSDKTIPVKLFGFPKNEQFGLYWNDKPVADSLFSAFLQFGKDQSWAGLEPQANLAADYYKDLLSRLNDAGSTVKGRKQIAQYQDLQYALNYNIGQCYIWLRNRKAALFFLRQCQQFPVHYDDTRELEWNFNDVMPLI